MAKIKTPISNMDDLIPAGVKEFAASAEMVQNNKTVTARQKGKAGRKPKLEENKRTGLLAVYLTVAEKEQVEEYCNRIGLPFSALVRQMLVEKTIL